MSTTSRAGHGRPVPSRSLLVRDIQVLATLDPELGDIRDAAIYVEGNVIRWVGASGDVPKDYSTADETVSLPDRVVIPGLVNTHHHMFQCLTRCVAQVCVSLPPNAGIRRPDRLHMTDQCMYRTRSCLLGWLPAMVLGNT